MAIPETITAAIADKPEVLEFVKGLDAKAGLLKPEIEKALPDFEKALPDLPKIAEYKAAAAALTKLLTETKAKDADALLTDFKNVVSVKDDLLKQKKEGKLGGEGGDVTKAPEYRALQEQIAEIKKASDERIAALENESKTAKESAARSESEKRETDLKASVVTAASKYKIRDPEDEFLLLKAKGLIGYAEKEGKQVPFFHKLNEKGEKVDAGSADALLKHIAETQKSKVDPSAKQGAGQEHRGQGGGGQKEVAMSSAAAHSAFLHG